jgi:G3E family GTPase
MAVPVTILCGELGAGKTTLLSRLLETTDSEIAVLVNDVGEVNVDADFVEARTDLETGDEVVALENGCICCSLGGELSRAVIQLWKEHEFDHLVVEASGVGEPEPIARQFVRGPAGGPYDLEAVVTVVDARRFYDRFAAVDGKPVREGPDETGTRPLADLLLEQVEFCDVLVVNKCDLVDDDERERVIAVLEMLQPRAEIVTASFGDVDPDVLLGSERFDLEAASDAAGWKRAIENDSDGHDHGEDHHGNGCDHDHDDDGDHGHHDHDHEHAHPPERYGIEVETYHRRRPFHPERFTSFLRSLPDGLIRAKGLSWIAGREDQAITMSTAGTETTLEVTGRWIASLSEERQEAFRREQTDLPWSEEWGDRESRLALIGRDLDWGALESQLDDCLLTDAELSDDWNDYENPTPTGMGETVAVSSAESANDAGRD